MNEMSPMNDAMRSAETIEIESLKVACDGGNGALGHPRVFLTIKPEVREVVCPYCSRRYVLKAGAKISHGH